MARPGQKAAIGKLRTLLASDGKASISFSLPKRPISRKVIARLR